MPTYSTAREATQVLVDAVQDAIAGTWADDVAPYEGAVCVWADDESAAVALTGRPGFAVTVEDRPTEDISGNDSREATATFTAVSNDFTGALTGTSNARSSHARLADLLQGVTTSPLTPEMLRAADIYRLRIERSAEVEEMDEDQNTTQAIQLRLTFTYFAF